MKITTHVNIVQETIKSGIYKGLTFCRVFSSDFGLQITAFKRGEAQPNEQTAVIEKDAFLFIIDSFKTAN